MMTSSSDVMRLRLTTLLLMTQVPVITAVFLSSTQVPLEFHIAEETAAGTLIGSAKDDIQLQEQADVIDSLRFSIRQVAGQSGTPSSEYFSVEEETGEIRLRQSIDREHVCLAGSRTCSIVFDVLVRPLTYFRIVRVIVYIDDINDNTPTFPEPQHILHVKESTPRGSKFPLPVATDADSGQFGILGFELASSSSDLFALEVGRDLSGFFELKLELTGSLDRELISEHRVTVVAFDGGLPQRSGTVNIIVVVTDANDNSPQFPSSSYEVEITENQLPISALVRVEATDTDEGRNSELVYSLAEFSELEHGQVFRINSSTGEVFLRHELDREITSVYSLTIMASDRGNAPLSAFTRLIVTVLDENDNSPRVVVRSTSPDNELIVLENAEPRTFIAYVSASDDDLGSAGKVDCYVDGTQFRLELLHATVQSEYKLISTTSFDRELQPVVHVTLTCSDRGHPRSNTVSVELLVAVLDENDNAPVIEQKNYEVEMVEGNAAGVEVVRINATDMDAGSNSELIFTMRSVDQTTHQDLRIDEKTGSVTANVTLDYETWRRYVYIVTVSDLGETRETRKTSTASLAVRVLDRDDERPQFGRSAYYFSVLEDVSAGTVVGQVDATDNDLSPRFSKVKYHIERNGVHLPFNVDEDTGQVMTVNELDRELQPVYEFHVIAADSSRIQTRVPVTVYIDDINDNSPRIISPIPTPDQETTFIIAPSTLAAGSLLTRFVAKDSDAGENGRVSYRLVHGNHDGLLEIEESTGALTTTRLVTSIQVVYRVVLAAEDHGEPPKQTLIDLTVVFNETANGRENGGKSFSDLLSSRSLLSEDRIFVVLGVVCGIVVALILALIVCALCVLRRVGSKSAGKPRLDATLQDHSDRMLTPVDGKSGHWLAADSSIERGDDWNAEYSKMIDEIRVNPTRSASLVSSESISTSASGQSNGQCSQCSSHRCRSRRSAEADPDAADVATSRPPTSLSTSSSLTPSSVTSSLGQHDARVRVRRSRPRAKSSASCAAGRPLKCVGLETDSDVSTDMSCRDSGLVLHDVTPQRRHCHHHHHHRHSHGHRRTCRHLDNHHNAHIQAL